MKVFEYYHWFLKKVLTVLMFLLMIPVSLQIFSSYIGFIPRYIWTEEMARFCFIWIILVGSIIAVREGTHFTVDLINLNSPKKDAMIAIFVDLTIVLTAMVFLIWGYSFVASSLYQSSEMAELPMVYIYMAWPIAGVSYIVFTIEKVMKSIKTIRSSEQ